jgi:hypothetical protein
MSVAPIYVAGMSAGGWLMTGYILYSSCTDPVLVAVLGLDFVGVARAGLFWCGPPLFRGDYHKTHRV